MKATFILKDLSQEFFDGGRWAIGLSNLEPLEAYLYLLHKVSQQHFGITVKVGNGSFRDRVDLNHKAKRGLNLASYTLEPRRGYKLATFHFN